MKRLLRALRRWWNTSAVQVVHTSIDCANRTKSVTKVTIETYKEQM